MSVSLVAVYHDFAFVSAFSFQLSVSISYIFTLFISLFVRSCIFLLLYLTSAGCTWAALRLKWKYNGCKEASCMINTIQVIGSFLVGCPILWERKPLLGYTAVLHSLSSCIVLWWFTRALVDVKFFFLAGCSSWRSGLEPACSSTSSSSAVALMRIWINFGQLISSMVLLFEHCFLSLKAVWPGIMSLVWAILYVFGFFGTEK